VERLERSTNGLKGQRLKNASRRLSHARTSITTDVYGYLLPNMQGKAAEMIDNLVTITEVKLTRPITIK
jgi:hypothetical protein